MSDIILETRNLKKYFKVNSGLLHAVDGVDLSISRGATLGVVGESGCGKSTLGRTVLRLLQPTGGEINFEGKNIVHCSAKEMKGIRPQMQMIFQDPYSSLNARMSVQQLIAEPMLVNKTYQSKGEIYRNTATWLIGSTTLAFADPQAGRNI